MYSALQEKAKKEKQYWGCCCYIREGIPNFGHQLWGKSGPHQKPIQLPNRDKLEQLQNVFWAEIKSGSV